jgi:hypothetical protein
LLAAQESCKAATTMTDNNMMNMPRIHVFRVRRPRLWEDSDAIQVKLSNPLRMACLLPVEN